MLSLALGHTAFPSFFIGVLLVINGLEHEPSGESERSAHAGSRLLRSLVKVPGRTMAPGPNKETRKWAGREHPMSFLAITFTTQQINS